MTTVAATLFLSASRLARSRRSPASSFRFTITPRPDFALIRHSLFKTYAPAIGLWATVCGAIAARDCWASPDVLPPSAAMLFVTTVCALLWGVGPGATVLALSTIASQILTPGFLLSAATPASIFPPAPPVDSHLLNAALFCASGIVTVSLTGQIRLLRHRTTEGDETLSVLQHMILPEKLECPEYCGIAAYYRAAGVSGSRRKARAGNSIGGDFYDVFALDGGRRMAVLIGDVMGHGASAARHTALLRYSARALASSSCSRVKPSQVLRSLNAMIEEQSISLGTATLFFALIDIKSGEMSYASAGHEPSLLMRAEAPGICESLEPTGMPLGCDPFPDYADQTLQLNPGDTLLLITDGATESRNARGALLGAQGVAYLLHKTRYASGAQEALRGIAQGIEAFSGTASADRDDTAMLLLHWNQAARFAQRIPASDASGGSSCRRGTSVPLDR